MILSHCNESDVAGCIINVIIARIHSFESYGKLALSERHATHDTEIFQKIFHRLPRGGGLPAAMIQTDFDSAGVVSQFELSDFVTVQEAAENAFVDRNRAVVSDSHTAFFFDLFQRVVRILANFQTPFLASSI